MAYNRVELAVGEWFHVYTKTIDGGRPFEHHDVAERFLETLYLANQSSPVPNIPHLHKNLTHEEIFLLDRTDPLVSIGAYEIMPTHYHLFVQPQAEDGLTTFMHKLGTGFTRFYNEKIGRIGNLFVKPFRAKHVARDGYFFHLPNYIHLNSADLFEPGWKEGRVRNIRELEQQIRAYRYSSLPDYEDMERAQRSILDSEAMRDVQEHLPPLRSIIREAAEYYRNLDLEL